MSRSNGRRSATLGAVTRSAIDSATGVNSTSFYDCKSGLSISVILALTLSWIPYVGPIVAGFVGGRRAGSILRGFIVGVFSSVIVFVIAFLLGLGLVKLFEPEYQSFIDALNGFAPFIVEGLEVLSTYLSTNFVTVASDMSVTLDIQTYAAIIGFAIIGGVFADQARKELRIIVSHSMAANKPRPRRSTSAFLEGHDLGFQTYGELSKLDVNSFSVSNADIASVKADVDVPDKVDSEPAQVDLLSSSEPVEDKDAPSPVTETVTEDVPADVAEEPVEEEPKESKKGADVKPNPSDDMEWF